MEVEVHFSWYRFRARYRKRYSARSETNITSSLLHPGPTATRLLYETPQFVTIGTLPSLTAAANVPRSSQTRSYTLSEQVMASRANLVNLPPPLIFDATRASIHEQSTCRLWRSTYFARISSRSFGPTYIVLTECHDSPGEQD